MFTFHFWVGHQNKLHTQFSKEIFLFNLKAEATEKVGGRNTQPHPHGVNQLIHSTSDHTRQV